MADNDIAFILLSEQDSELAFDMMRQLRSTANKLIESGRQMSAIGPRYLDERQNSQPPFLRIEGLQAKRQYDGVNGSVVDVDYLIASGCLISVNVLKDTGLRNEDLFIDYVDIEPGLRTKNKGFQSFGDFKANMLPSLGENSIIFWEKSYPAHSLLHHYYMTRNAVWLYKQPHIPIKCKIVDGYRLLLRIGFYILYAKLRMKHFRMMKEIYHGVISQMGLGSRTNG